MWKILKEMGISDLLTCLLRNLFVGQKAAVRTLHGTTDWFKIGKRVRQGSACLLNLYTENIMRNAGLDEAQAGIKIARRNINNFRYADDTTLMPEIEEELKNLDEGKRGEWKSWLKTQHSKNKDRGIWFHHFIASRKGKKEKQWQIFFPWAPKLLWMMTAAIKLEDACSMEGKVWQI